MHRTLSPALLLLALCLTGCPADPQPSDERPPALVSPGPSDGAAASSQRDRNGRPVAPEPGLAAALEERGPTGERLLERWLDGIAEAGDAGFSPREEASDELSLYAVESEAATGFCLRAEVDPHRRPAHHVRWDARPARGGAPDLLRARWKAEGLSLTLTEGLNVVFVQIEEEAQPRPKLTGARLRALAARVARTDSVDHTWIWDVPVDADLTRGTHLFRSRGAPERLELLQTRDDRADLLVVEGRVILVCYKKIAQRVGFERGSTWFRDSTRAALTRP